ncbi:MAG: efflux RND transporter permease subunit [Gemmatimonadaceae bacterium]|nr:efflux RND transporter permease subunit [Gemmatimonadaceae bacterium]
MTGASPPAGGPPEASGAGGASSLFAVTTRRPVAILMVVMAVCVFGWVSYQRLSLELMPDVAYPALTVRTKYPGSAPEEVEKLVSRPLERELGILPRLVAMRSISKAGQSDVVLEFEWETDMNAAAADIREKVDRTWLPEEAGKPLLLRYDPSLEPVLRVGLSGGRGLYHLRVLAEEEVRRELESIPGVAAVKVRGGLEQEIHVALRERQIALLGLDAATVEQRLAEADVNLPGGRLREGGTEYLVRTLNELDSVAEIEELVVARSGGAEIRLRDIARVEASHKDREILTRVNGRESVDLEIHKEAGANIVAVARAVRDRLLGTEEQRAWVASRDTAATAPEAEAGKDAEARRKAAAVRTVAEQRMTDFVAHRLPAGVGLDVLSDQSAFIESSIDEVRKNVLLGGAIAGLVLLVFLRNVVHTLIVAVTIPVSVVATFAPMHLFDVSLNIMSLGGLALGVGMLVDNSIVVLESIFRCREEGDDPVTATVRGTAAVSSAVCASTLTTVAVFFPIVFVEGVAGQVFGDMALTVVFSLLASLAVALWFIPMLASRSAGLPGLAPESPFLRLPSGEGLRRAVGPGLALGARLRQGALVLPLLLRDLAARALLALAAVLWAVLQSAGLLIFQCVWPLLWLAARWRPGLPSHRRVAGWASRPPPVRGFPDSVWPGLLDNGSAAALGADWARWTDWVRGPGSRTGFAARALSGVPVILWLLPRFLVHDVLCLARSLLLTVLLVAAVLAAGALVLAALVLSPAAPVLAVLRGGLELARRTYPGLLGGALRRRAFVLGGAALAFWACWTQLLPALGTELIPPVHQGEFRVDLTLPVGTPLERTAEAAAEVEAIALALPGVERAATRVGSDRTAAATADEGEHTARVAVYLAPEVGPDAEDRVIEDLRGRLRRLPEVETEISFPSLFSLRTPVEVEIRGEDLGGLRRLSAETVSVLSALPGLADVRSTQQAGHPELQILYDRERLASYGLDLRAVAERVRHKVQGRVATGLRRDERTIDVLVRLREEDRLGVDELRRLVVNPGGEVPIRLGSVAAIRIAEGPSEIRRIDQQRAALVTANVEGLDLGTAAGAIRSTLGAASFPPGFTFLVSGQSTEMERSLESLLFALGLAVFLVYIVMAGQFESLVHPFVILFTVPLAATGAVVALYLMETPLSVVVFIGFIMLAGIVVNNAIVLVDYINRLRRSGLAAGEAIVRAGAVRLRPILMTTSTTVLGLLPMALGLGDGAEIRSPMAVTVIAGLVSSTFLTLVVIPAVYSLTAGREGPGGSA